MLESLVSSRVRRTLLEYLVAHPHERFYLRGLAKELGLSTSPLQRELKRLERVGLLTVSPEANLRFYCVNQASPLFAELRAAAGGEALRPTVVIQAAPSKISWRAMVAAAVLAATLTALITRTLTIPNPRVVMTQAAPRASGEMRGAHVRLLPGAVGGWATPGASDESY